MRQSVASQASFMSLTPSCRAVNQGTETKIRYAEASSRNEMRAMELRMLDQRDCERWSPCP